QLFLRIFARLGLDNSNVTAPVGKGAEPVPTSAA
ncbi:MAG: hypothetical protein QOE77_4255, partial [Blastocatellia bacterium]|nr:hypothetical protein [Blastocatellia bacterium]